MPMNRPAVVTVILLKSGCRCMKSTGKKKQQMRFGWKESRVQVNVHCSLSSEARAVQAQGNAITQADGEWGHQADPASPPLVG